MKYILLLLFVSGSCGVLAQDNLTMSLDSLKKITISNRTELGKPKGEKNSNVIGPGGGIITSPDNAMELIIPAGALVEDTLISIQPVSNMVFGGIGNAYDCEPSGLQFKKPVNLIFHYTDSESKENNAVLQNLSWQDKEGEWHTFEKISLDTITKTISGSISHFTQFSRKVDFRLSVPSGNVHVRKEISEMLFCNIIPDRYGDMNANRVDLINAFYDNERFRWYVNDIENGDAVNGKINFTGFTPHGRLANYLAPTTPPPVNPVKITVEMDGPITLNNGITMGKVSTSAYITVVGDQYHFTFIHIDENGCYFLVDSSSCILNMKEHDVTISNIKNYPPWSDWPPSCDGCRWEWTNKESLKGLVEITGIASSQITPPDDTHPVPNVNISFSPATGNTPSAKVTCPRSSPITVPSKPYPASPQNINFDIDGDDVIIHAAGKTGRNELVIQGDKEKAIIYIYKLN